MFLKVHASAAAMFARFDNEAEVRGGGGGDAERLRGDRSHLGRGERHGRHGDEIAARRELIRLLDSTRNENVTAGMVHLVGAGPGDPDLLTMKAHRLLQEEHALLKKAIRFCSERKQTSSLSSTTSGKGSR